MGPRRVKPPLVKRLGRGALKLGKWLLLFALVALGGIYGYVRYDYASAADDLDYQVQRAKDLGLPLDPDELNPHPPVRHEDNAAPLYREMSGQFTQLENRLQGDRLRNGLAAPYRHDLKDIDVSIGVLKEIQPTLEVAIAASKKAGVDFKRDWSQGPNVLFPELAKQKEAAKWLTARAVLYARSGRLTAGLDDINAVGRIGNHVALEKTLIGGLVNVAIDAIAVRGLEHIASHNSDRADVLKRLKLLIQDLPTEPKLKECLKSEVFLGFYTSRNLSRFWSGLSNESSDASNMMGVHRWRVFPPLIDSDLVEQAYAARSLGFWNDMFTMQEGAQWNPILASAELDRMAIRYGQSHRPSDALGAILFPVFAQVGAAFEKMKANRACVRGMIEVLLFKNKHGRLPKTLAEAGVKDIDPFNGEPFKYRRTDAGFVIYSVGYDRKDDGGLLSWEKTVAHQGWNHRDEPMAVFPSWERARQATSAEQAAGRL